MHKKEPRPCHWHCCPKNARRGSILCAEHQAIEDATPAAEGYRGRLFLVTEEEESNA